MTGTHNGPGNCLHGKPMSKDNCDECKRARGWGATPSDPTPIVIDTPDGIAAFHMLQVIGALSLEVNTGMKVGRGSLVKLAQQRYGCTGRIKSVVLAQMRAKYTEATGLVCKVGLR